MISDQLREIDFSAVAETGLLTLYCKALESQSEDPILVDQLAENLVRQIDPILQSEDSAMAKQLRNRAMDPRLAVHLALRSRKYDDFVRDFLEREPSGLVINLGCGLDMRFFRIDNGDVRFYDLDLPEVIDVKQKLIPHSERYQLIGQSVLDLSWIETISAVDSPTLILAEGLLMYLPEDEVRRLVLALQIRFPESELVCELTNRTWVDGLWGKLAQMKMQNQLKMQAQAAFQFGVNAPEDLEAYGPGVEVREMWFYMDENHPKLGWYRIFRGVKMIRTAQFTVRYILHSV